MRKKIKLEYWDDRELKKEMDKQVYQEFLRGEQMPEAGSRYSENEVQFIRMAVPNLPEKERKVIYLLFWRNYQLYEVARYLEITEKTVLKLKESALKRLKCAYLNYFDENIEENNRLVS